MTRLTVTALLLAAGVAATSGQGQPAAADPTAFDGTWTLNRELSQFPREVGFGMDVIRSSRSEAGDVGGGGGRDRGGSPEAVPARPESEDMARNRQQLVAEVRTPPARLTITQTAAAVTVTDERGRSRTFHPDGREEFQPLDAGPIPTTTRWEGARLVVRYKLEQGREVRYTYSRRADPPQLVVQAELLERGDHDTVSRVYQPATASDLLSAVEPPSPERGARPALPAMPTLPSQRAVAGQGPPGEADPGKALVPAAGGQATPAQFDQRPGAELKGLAVLGVVVEDLNSQAASCGLRQDAIEAAVSKSLADAGLKVVRNSDEDSYLYVNVITTSMPTGYCFSRYDASVYTNTTATLSYGSRPVLVQVSLLHKGGITGSGASTHGETVVQTIRQYVDQFAAQIRAANK